MPRGFAGYLAAHDRGPYWGRPVGTMGSRRVAVIKQMQKFDGAFSWAAKIQFNFLYDVVPSS
jgi:hypothetical protein